MELYTCWTYMNLCLVHEDFSDGTDACVPVDLCTEHAELEVNKAFMSSVAIDRPLSSMDVRVSKFYMGLGLHSYHDIPVPSKNSMDDHTHTLPISLVRVYPLRTQLP